MALNLSFPNFLCLLLIGFLFVNLMSRERTMGNQQKPPEGLETIFCRLPQSFWRGDLKTCISTGKLFTLLMNDCSFDIRRKNKTHKFKVETNDSLVEEGVIDEDDDENDMIVPKDDEHDNSIQEDPEPEEESENEDSSEEENSSLSLVYSFVISLLVCSAVVSILELYREKTKSNEKLAHGENGPGPEGESTGNRRISLAELTVNRHLRRRDSQHQLETIRQSSTSGSKPPPLIRRSSFPSQLPEVHPPRSRHAPRRQMSTPGIPLVRRMSMDLSEDDSSPDRRRVRIIRRH